MEPRLDFWVEATLYSEEYRMEFFPNTIDKDVKQAIREHYSNAASFSDGDIFRGIRLCQIKGQSAHVRKWLARLSESKRDDILQLERSADQIDTMVRFQKALDDLLPLACGQLCALEHFIVC